MKRLFFFYLFFKLFFIQNGYAQEAHFVFLSDQIDQVEINTDRSHIQIESQKNSSELQGIIKTQNQNNCHLFIQLNQNILTINATKNSFEDCNSEIYLNTPPYKTIKITANYTKSILSGDHTTFILDVTDGHFTFSGDIQKLSCVKKINACHYLELTLREYEECSCTPIKEENQL